MTMPGRFIGFRMSVNSRPVANYVRKLCTCPTGGGFGHRRLGRYFVGLVMWAWASPLPTHAAQPAQPIGQQLELCIACHGDATRAGQPEVPGIAGQPKLFTMYQLFFFREGRRKSPEMNVVAKSLTDADLTALSEAVEKLPPKKSSLAGADPARYQRGAELSAAHGCQNCHNPDYSGREQMPRLGGQHEAYMVKAMQDYKTGARVGTQAAMAEVLSQIDDVGIADLAHYLSHFQP
jgi:cytochrome c553